MSSMTIVSEPAHQLSPVASIVHDLRNPLAAIHGGAEMLAGSILSQAQVQRIARNVYCASVRMRELLEEFLHQSSRAEKKIEFTYVGELVTGAVAKIAISAEFQSVRIFQAVPEGLAISVDGHRIHRVLVNLLVNALDAMPHGGSVHISAVSERGSVLIRVRDTGPGIALEISDRLFQPFVTAGKPDGIGLGLAFSRQAVLDHGGEMWAESSPQGACFTVRLPLTSEPDAISC
jgi:signal transduction histidine kinase